MFIAATRYGISAGSNDPLKCYIESNDIYELHHKGVDSSGNVTQYECSLKSDHSHIYLIDTNIAEKLIEYSKRKENIL